MMMKNDVTVYRKEKLEPQNLFPGATVTFIHSEQMTFAEWNFEANTPLPEHTHPHEQITKVLSGKLELVVDGQKNTLNAGDSVVIPSNVVHSAFAVSECNVVDVFHPVRQEYK